MTFGRPVDIWCTLPKPLRETCMNLLRLCDVEPPVKYPKLPESCALRCYARGSATVLHFSHYANNRLPPTSSPASPAAPQPLPNQHLLQTIEKLPFLPLDWSFACSLGSSRKLHSILQLSDPSPARPSPRGPFPQRPAIYSRQYSTAQFVCLSPSVRSDGRSRRIWSLLTPSGHPAWS